jgi:hypothetical protein
MPQFVHRLVADCSPVAERKMCSLFATVFGPGLILLKLGILGLSDLIHDIHGR